MKTKLLIGSILAALIGAAAWFAWDRFTTPAPPIIALAGVNRERAEKVKQALDEVQRQPRSGRAWAELSMVLLANGFFEQSMPCFSQAERFDPQQPRWPYFHATLLLTYANPQEGFAKLRQALGLAHTPQVRAVILFQLALALVEAGQLDEAEPLLQELQQIEDDSPAAHFGLGLLALTRGNRSAAREHLSTLTDNPAARKRVCLLLAGLHEGNEELSQSFRRRADQLPEDQPWPGSFEKDLQNYRAILEHPLATYEQLVAENRRAEAMDLLRTLAAQSPDESICFTLGFNLVTMDAFEEAEKPLRQAVSFNPQNVKAHHFLGIALYHMGEKLYQQPEGKDQALRFFRQAVTAEENALKLQSQLYHAHLIRGKALKYLNRTAESIAALRQAVEVGSEKAEVHLALGEALAEAGQVREALEHLENAVRIDPVGKRPREALEKWRVKAKATP